MQQIGYILIVDNDTAIIDFLVELLTEEGYIVYSVPDGAEALAAIAWHPPALILLNLWMPFTSGADLIAQVRAAGRPAVPIVILTTAPPNAEALVVPGSIECLAKPFEINELLACVVRYVRPDQAVGQPCT